MVYKLNNNNTPYIELKFKNLKYLKLTSRKLLKYITNLLIILSIIFYNYIIRTSSTGIID